MKFQLTMLIIGAALSLQDAPAQTDQPQPTAPYLGKIPKMAHWTIALTYPAAAAVPGQPRPPTAVPAGYPVVIDTIRTGRLRQVTFKTADGKSAQFDENGKFVLFHNPGLTVHILEADSPPYPYYTKGFLFAEWVARAGISAFKGVEKVGSVTCFHYAENGQETWLAADTLLPVKTRENGVEAVFQFLPAPEAKLVFPADEEAWLQHDEQTTQALQSVR